MGILPLASSSICVWSSCSFDSFRSQWGWGWCQAVSFLLCCQLKSWRAGVALHPAAGRSGKDMQQSRAREHPLEGGWGRALLVSGLEKKREKRKRMLAFMNGLAQHSDVVTDTEFPAVSRVQRRVAIMPKVPIALVIFVPEKGLQGGGETPCTKT